MTLAHHAAGARLARGHGRGLRHVCAHCLSDTRAQNILACLGNIFIHLQVCAAPQRDAPASPTPPSSLHLPACLASPSLWRVSFCRGDLRFILPQTSNLGAQGHVFGTLASSSIKIHILHFSILKHQPQISLIPFKTTLHSPEISDPHSTLVKKAVLCFMLLKSHVEVC